MGGIRWIAYIFKKTSKEVAVQSKRIRKKDLGKILRKRSVSFVAERLPLTVMYM